MSTGTVEEVSLKAIIRSEEYQARSHMIPGLVRQYAKAMENGSPFPAIQLADINGALFLVDGWHRHAAATSLNLGAIDAVITPMTRSEALRAAALANNTHGAPLKPKERREAFRLFVKGKGHKNPDGSLMSYRDIATALGGHVGHTTIYGWMEKDFPKVAQAMGVDAVRGKGNGEPPRIDLELKYFRDTSQALTDTQRLYELLKDPENRYAIIQQMGRALEEMKAAPHTAPEF